MILEAFTLTHTLISFGRNFLGIGRGVRVAERQAA